MKALESKNLLPDPGKAAFLKKGRPVGPDDIPPSLAASEEIRAQATKSSIS